MAFREYEKNGISWVQSDLIPFPHMFTRKLGAVGEFPFSSNYDPEWLRAEVQARVRSIWLNVCAAGDFPEEGFCMNRQVHGTDIRYVTASDRRLPPLEGRPMEFDGVITDQKRVPLCVFTADCVPVLLADESAGVVCAVHSGWKGTVRDMMGAAVAKMTAMGAKSENIRAAVGPAVGQCCFEVGPEVGEAIEALLGTEDSAGLCIPERGVPGKFMADIKETNRRRLMQLGVPAENIDVSSDCTICRQDIYWSHRATKGVRGTQANIIMLP